MDATTKRSVERAIAWCGPAFVVLFTISWGIMGHNIPPPNMIGMSANELVSEYYGKYPSIGPGMIFAATVGMLYMPWSCLLASMLKDENGHYGVLSFMELAGGLLTAWLLAFCSAMWAACSILVTQVPPETIKMIHVMTWCIFDCTYMITTIQMVGLGLYTVLNRQQTLFPAWAGWLTIAIGVAFVPLVIMPFVSEGPCMVAGLWTFYIIFGAWLLGFFSVYSYYMLRHLYSTGSQPERFGREASLGAR